MPLKGVGCPSVTLLDLSFVFNDHAGTCNFNGRNVVVDHAKVRPGDVFVFATPNQCDALASAQKHYLRRVQRTKIAEGKYRCTVYDPTDVPDDVRRALKKAKKRPTPFLDAIAPDDREWRAFYARVGEMRPGHKWTLRMPRMMGQREYEAVREHLRHTYPRHRLHFGPRKGQYLRLSRLADD